MTLVRHGDDVAFRVLYERYRGQLFTYCVRMLNDREAAMDTLQDIFVRLHRKRNLYQVGTNFAGWIHTIARNLCLNARRDVREFIEFDETMILDPAQGDNDRDVGLRDQLAAEIQRLPEDYREVVILREYEDRSYNDIVKITGLSMATVKFRIFKAREILRQRLAWGLDEINDND